MSRQILLSHWELDRQKLRDIIQKIFEKIGCHSDDVGPRPLKWISRNEA